MALPESLQDFYKRRSQEAKRLGYGCVEGPKGFDDESWFDTVDFEAGTRRVAIPIEEIINGVSTKVGVRFITEKLPEIDGCNKSFN